MDTQTTQSEAHFPDVAAVMAVARMVANDEDLRKRAAEGDTADLLSKLEINAPAATKVKILMNDDSMHHVVLPPVQRSGEMPAETFQYAMSLAEKIANDEDLRKRAAEGDTADVTQGLEIDVTPTTKVKILLDRDDVRHLVLPGTAGSRSSDRELSDEELESVSGGVDWEPTWGTQQSDDYYGGDWRHNWRNENFI